MTITTNHLILTPLCEGDLKARIASEGIPELRTAYSQMLREGQEDRSLWLFHTLWKLSPKSDSASEAGLLSFRGIDGEGTSEIGYGLNSGFEGQGFMTEAVRAVTDWALTQPGVTRIEAETGPDNTASISVLLRCGFVPTGKTGEEGPRFVKDSA